MTSHLALFRGLLRVPIVEYVGCADLWCLSIASWGWCKGAGVGAVVIGPEIGTGQVSQPELDSPYAWQLPLEAACQLGWGSVPSGARWAQPSLVHQGDAEFKQKCGWW